MLIHPDEDGNCVDFITSEELDETLDNPVEERGIHRFITGKELEEMENSKDYHSLDPQYWEQGTCLLLQYTVLEVKPVVTKYEVV